MKTHIAQGGHMNKKWLRIVVLVPIVTVLSILFAVLLGGCPFSPGGGADDDEMVVDADDGGSDGGDNDAGVDAPMDASIDALGDNHVSIELVTPDNVSSSFSTDVKLVTGSNVGTCVRSSSPSLADWDGGGVVTSNPFHVTMALGLNRLTATCTTIGGQQLPDVTLEVRAMKLEAMMFGIAWEAPADPGDPVTCTAIAIPQVSGGFQNNGPKPNPGSDPDWHPLGTSIQGFRCQNVTGSVVYRATVQVIAM